MSLRKDYRLHLAVGVATVVATVFVIEIHRRWGLGAAAAAATTLIGVAYELVQRYRKEGEPSWKDALATALPGWTFWLVYFSAKG